LIDRKAKPPQPAQGGGDAKPGVILLEVLTHEQYAP
jgi:hypothetical protein